MTRTSDTVVEITRPNSPQRQYSDSNAGNFLDSIKLALQEDIGAGDVTASLVPPRQLAKATVISREKAIIAGRDWFNAVFLALDPFIKTEWHVADGDSVDANTVLVTVTGIARPILTGERTALNFLQTLSGTATRVRRYVDAVAGTGVKILDTRKTIPCLRDAQKYAVTCGGGYNHRTGLYDGILIKENHIFTAGSISAAIANAKQRYPRMAVEVEAETLDQLHESIEAGADIVLLDNMDLETLRDAVEISGGRIKLEASGGIDLSNVRAVAETGVDFISIGSLTKHVTAVDLSMRFDW